MGAPSAPASGTLGDALVKTDRTVFRVDGGLKEFDTAFYARERLPVGEALAGPAIILQKDSTTVVRPEDTAELDAAGNLLIRIGANA